MDQRRVRRRYLGVVLFCGAVMAIIIGVLYKEGSVGHKEALPEPPNPALVAGNSAGGHTVEQAQPNEELLANLSLADTLELRPQQFSPSGSAVTPVLNDEADEDAARTSAAEDEDASTICYAEDDDELRDSVERQDCAFVMLSSVADHAYDLENEIVVSRNVTIMGSPATMPTIWADKASRAFRVKTGAYLEVKYIMLVPSEDTEKLDRRAQSEIPANDGNEPPSQVKVVRGGAALFEPGAAGGLFVGVFFIEDPDLDEATAGAIQLTLDQTTIRVYGGFIFMAGGELDLVGCLFWSLGVLSPITDMLMVGGLILVRINLVFVRWLYPSECIFAWKVVGGQVTITGSTFIENQLLSMENSIGMRFAVFGGSLIVTFSSFDENKLIFPTTGLGRSFFVAGGVFVVIGVDYFGFAGITSIMGTGEFTLLGGVQVITGLSSNEAFAIGTAYGVGTQYTVGAGLSINTGVSSIMWTGIYLQATLGEMSFLGTGTYISVATPFQQWTAIGGMIGMGGTTFNGAGFSYFLASPVLDISAISMVFELGTYMALGAGMMAWISSPVVKMVALEYSQGLGSVAYVGAGSLLVGMSPLVEFMPLSSAASIPFWVQGSCYTEEMDNGTSTPFTYIDGSRGCPSDGSSRTLPERRPVRAVGDVLRHSAPIKDQMALLSSLTGLGKDNVGLLAYNITRQINPGLEDITAGLPKGWRETIADVEVQLRELHKHRSLESAEPLSTIFVNKAPAGSCLVCDVQGGVSGPGADHCRHDQSCAATGPPFTSRSEGIIHTEHLIVMGDLTFTTSSTANALIRTESLREALVDATAQLKSRQGVMDTIHCQVHSAIYDLPDRMIANLHLPPLTRSLHETEEFNSTNHFKVIFVATSWLGAELVRSALSGDDVSGTSAELSSMLRAAVGKVTEVGHMGLSLERLLTVPAYNLLGLANVRALTKIGRNTVMLLDPEAPAVLVSHVIYDKEYVIHLEQFPPGVHVSIHMLRTSRSAASEQSPLLLADISTDATGTAEVRQTFRRTAVRRGDYFLEAFDNVLAGGCFGHSPSYTFTSRRRRTLYGPTVRM